MKLKKMTTRPTLAVSARTAVLVVLTSPSSAAELALIWPAQKAPARKRTKMYDIPHLVSKLDEDILTIFFEQDDDMPELEGEEKGDKKIEEIS